MGDGTGYTGGYDPKTSQEVFTNFKDGLPVAEVSDDGPALENYERRTDVETLANRRAREASTTFAEIQTYIDSVEPYVEQTP